MGFLEKVVVGVCAGGIMVHAGKSREIWNVCGMRSLHIFGGGGREITD